MAPQPSLQQAPLLATVMTAAEQLMAGHKLPEWLPAAFESIAYHVGSRRRWQAHSPKRETLAETMRGLQADIQSVEKRLADIRELGAGAMYLRDHLLTVPRSLLIGLADGQSWAKERTRIFSGHSRADALDAAGEPNPRLVCARGVVVLRVLIDGSQPDQRNKPAQVLCDALWRLSDPADAQAPAGLARLEQWAWYLRNARVVDTDRKAIAAAIIEHALTEAGVPLPPQAES